MTPTPLPLAPAGPLSPRPRTGPLAGAESLAARLVGPDLAALAARVALAVPFWKSGVLKWSGFLDLSPVAVTLFADEFRLQLPGGPYPLPAPGLLAFAAGVGEIVLPVLLVLGLFSRFAALGLLAMTAVIQLIVPGGWPLHLTWAALALAVLALGPGRASLDRMLGRA